MLRLGLRLDQEASKVPPSVGYLLRSRPRISNPAEAEGLERGFRMRTRPHDFTVAGHACDEVDLVCQRRSGRGHDVTVLDRGVGETKQPREIGLCLNWERVQDSSILNLVRLRTRRRSRHGDG